MKCVKQKKPRDEARVLNSDGISHKWSQNQVGPLRNTASDA